LLCFPCGFWKMRESSLLQSSDQNAPKSRFGLRMFFA